MKLLTYRVRGTELIGRLSPDGQYVWPLRQFGFPQRDMNELIETADPAALAALSRAAEAAEAVPLAEVHLCAPIPVPRQDILCLGINFPAHQKEAVGYNKAAFERAPEYAMYFSKRVNRCVDPFGAIDAHADLTQRLDYESELAVILGRDASRVQRGEAGKYIFGFTVINDVSARDVQTQRRQYTFGKSMDGFTPMGPWIVTADEFTLPLHLGIRSWVNGELRQNGNIDEAFFSLEDVLADVTRGITLRAGSVIAMGTPAGVGMGFTPPRFLQHGDTVRCEVEGIGAIENTVE